MTDKNHFLELKAINKSFGSHTIIDNFNLSMEQGTMTTLLGPSGCGKTTILRLIAGLEKPTSGQIFLENNEITHQSIQQRDIGIVFQSYALFPHMSIGENIGYGLKMQGISRVERERQIKEALALVDLSGFESRYVDQISGGQQQRVALARALVVKPKVLLFDEPLSNLDANLRRIMREKIRELQQQLNITALYVTHDQTEAFAVSDQIVVMNHGTIQQQGTAQHLYSKPNSLFLANFMGESSILFGKRINGQIIIGEFQLSLEHITQFNIPNGDCLIGIRPEAIELRKSGHTSQYAQLQRAIYMGNHWEIILSWQQQTLLVHLNPEYYDPQQSHYYVHFNPRGIFLLNTNPSDITLKTK